jgi:hypothetical protein
VKKDLLWLGYKVHVSETCDDPPACGCPPDPAAARPRQCARDILPNLITHVATTDATVPDAVMTTPLTQALHARNLAPARHYADSGYASPQAIADAARLGVTLVTPLRADTSRQARENNGYHRSAFTPDYDARTLTCPQGQTSQTWYPTAGNVIAVRFAAATCRPCPARQQCTTSRNGRQVTLPPQDLHELQAAARTTQDTKDWQHDYRRRAGIEATISHAITITATRRARYRGLAKTRLEHNYTAAALNLHRLDAYWNDTPIDRTRTTHLARLEHKLHRAALPSELTNSVVSPEKVTRLNGWRLKSDGPERLCQRHWTRHISIDPFELDTLPPGTTSYPANLLVVQAHLQPVSHQYPDHSKVSRCQT